MSQPKIALVYDWATTRYGGAELVLQALHQAFPTAPLYTSIANPEQATWLKDWPVKTTFLQQLPLAKQHHRWFHLWMPIAFETLDLHEYDIIISVTSAYAKGIITLPNQLHICYLLTPPRYLYSHQEKYLGQGWVRQLARPFVKYLSWWDKVAADRPDKIIALSNLVAQRTQIYYQRAVDEVIYPPVEIPKTKNHSLPADLPQPKSFFLIVSRLVTYKQIDLAIQACLQAQQHLIVIGDGPDFNRLHALANQSSLIHFLHSQPSSVTNWYLSHCQALLMPGLEDFGISALEVVAHGRPVILHQLSGAAELLTHKNAVFLKEISVDAIVQAIQQVVQTTYKPELLKQSVTKYATTTFVKNMQKSVQQFWFSHHQERTS